MIFQIAHMDHIMILQCPRTVPQYPSGCAACKLMEILILMITFAISNLLQLRNHFSNICYWVVVKLRLCSVRIWEFGYVRLGWY